jgi:hypothetical protein
MTGSRWENVTRLINRAYEVYGEEKEKGRKSGKLKWSFQQRRASRALECTDHGRLTMPSTKKIFQTLQLPTSINRKLFARLQAGDYVSWTIDLKRPCQAGSIYLAIYLSSLMFSYSL